MRCFQADVLVIGGGASGLMAAYRAAKGGVSVVVAAKGELERYGCSVMASGAIAGSGYWAQEGDSPDLHFSDTVKGGAFLSEQGLVKRLAETSPGLILEMESIGALWQREEDGQSYTLRIDGGHSFSRCPYIEDRPGREMLRVLRGELCKRHVTTIENLIITRLIRSEGHIAGAVGLDLTDARPVLIRAKAVVLACGGAGMLYKNTSNPFGVTGDGFALALQAGAELMDMEFVQFYPLGFLFPPSLRGGVAGLTFYSHLRNSEGDRFMLHYDPQRGELSTRDLITRAILQEVREGRGGPLGGILMDMTHQEPGFIKRMQPAAFESYVKVGFDPEKEYLEVAPTCHFFMGGVRVDTGWSSTLPGLFVAGETGSGVHGANRLSQNALAELLVSGHYAGISASGFASENQFHPVDPAVAEESGALAENLLSGGEGVRPLHLRGRLRELMWDKVGVFRTCEGLSQALKDLESIESELPLQRAAQKSRVMNMELQEGIENYFLLQTALCVTRSALLRTESRGAHYRDDHPDADDSRWLQHIVCQQSGGRLQDSLRPVDLCEIRPEGRGERL